MKTTQIWMGHADTTLMLNLYTKPTRERAEADALKLDGFLRRKKSNQAVSENDKAQEALLPSGSLSA